LGRLWAQRNEIGERRRRAYLSMLNLVIGKGQVKVVQHNLKMV
jgi:hypothetical protein